MSDQGLMQIYKDEARKINENLYRKLIEIDILNKRQHNPDQDERKRDNFQRDYTRIMYSSAFRRLQGKMQLLNMDSNSFIRNRLTHSLEVAQIARSIANDIGYNAQDIYVVEGCALAHDIGNPPFGHYGEDVLNDIIMKNTKGEMGFEGNAQTLRVLTTLQTKSTEFIGMNLTNRTLFGVIKYFHPFEGIKNKKYIYNNDYEIMTELQEKYNIPKRTLDVQIVDIADEIAYAAHDIEDTLKNRRFTIDEFLAEFKSFADESENNGKYASVEIDRAKVCLNDCIKAARRKAERNPSQYNDLFCKEIGSKVIFELIRDIKLLDNGEIGFNELGFLAKSLKKVTFSCVNKGNEVRLYEKRGKLILENLFDFYFENPEFLPQEFNKIILQEKNGKARATCDYISGMMDVFATNTYEKIYGKDRLDTFGVIKDKRNDKN